MPEDRGLWPAYLSGGKLYPTTSTMTIPINATLVAERTSSVMSSSLPNPPGLNRSSYSSPKVHEYAVTSASDVKHVRPCVLSIGRNDPGGSSISRTASSPIDLRSAKNIGGISSRSISEGLRAWNPHSSSVTPRSSYSPPTEDDSDFEMGEQSTLGRTFNRSGKQEESGGKAPEWDGLEMEMEM